MPRDADARKSAILAAVAEVIVEIGFTAMTVADVARRAGVSTALVHYHFSSKSDLIRAAISVAGEEERSSREAIAARDASAQDRIAEMLIGSLPEGPDDPTWLLWIETWGEIRRLPEVRRLMEDLDRHELESISALIVSGRANGEFALRGPGGHGAATRGAPRRSCRPADVVQRHRRGGRGAPVAQRDVAQPRVALGRSVLSRCRLRRR